jgi:hypothetical protein
MDVGPPRIVFLRRAGRPAARRFHESAFQSFEMNRMEPTVEPTRTAPDSFHLRGADPDPFSPETSIRFDLPAAASIRVDIFNLLGERIDVLRRSSETPGSDRRIVFDGSGLPGGLYLYRITARTGSETFSSVGSMTLES